MSDHPSTANHSQDDAKRSPSEAGEVIESDNVVRWDGQRLYVEQDVYKGGQLVHRRYRRTVTDAVARAISDLLASKTP